MPSDGDSCGCKTEHFDTTGFKRIRPSWPLVFLVFWCTYLEVSSRATSHSRVSSGLRRLGCFCLLRLWDFYMTESPACRKCCVCVVTSSELLKIFLTKTAETKPPIVETTWNWKQKWIKTYKTLTSLVQTSDIRRVLGVSSSCLIVLRICCFPKSFQRQPNTSSQQKAAHHRSILVNQTDLQSHSVLLLN